MSTIQVFEHERLTKTEDYLGRYLTDTQFEKLCQFNDNNDNKYFTVIRNGVKFNQYVGVIQIGSLLIEILPKADKNFSQNKEEHSEQSNTWRKVLLSMLNIAGEIKLETVSEASLKKRHNSILDLYFELFIKEVDLLLKKGLIKKYRKESGNVTALKGRLDFSKDINKNLIHRERFFTHHQKYDYEHLINQIILKALKVLNKISNNPLLNDRINKLIFNFPEIKEIEITKLSFDAVILNRKSTSYNEAIKIAKMIILNYSPDISRGNDDMLALLFDMNKLWEKYIYRLMKRGEEVGSYSVSYHNKKDFWNKRRIEPDIVLKKEEEIYIIDTKWKVLNNKQPSDDDLKQMYVYNMYWDAPKSILLYPMSNTKDDGEFGNFHMGRDGINQCKVGFISVLNDKKNGLNIKIGTEIVTKLVD